MGQADLSVSAALTGEAQVSSALDQMRRGVESLGATGKTAIMPWEKETEQLNAALQDNILRLKAQKELLQDPVYMQSARQAKALRQEIDEMTGANQKNEASWTSIASKAFLAAQAFRMVGNAAGAFIGAASEYDALNMRLKATEGSAVVAASRMREIIELSKQPGIGVSQSAAGYAQMRAMNVTGAESIKVINGIAKANAAMGGGAEEFGRAMSQITQAYGKQKLMGEELMTISESIPNIRGIIQQAFGGMSMDAINAKYSINEIMLKIAEAAEKLPPSGDTIKNAADNIGDGWKRMLANLSNTSTIKDAGNAIANLLETVNGSLESSKAYEARFGQVLASHSQTLSANQALRYIQYKRLTDDEQKWIETGKANTAVYASNMAEQEKIEANAREKRKASSDLVRNSLTKIDEDLKKTDKGAKVKEENEWYAKQARQFRENIAQTNELELAEAMKRLDAAHRQHLAEINKKGSGSADEIRAEEKLNNEARAYAHRIEAAEAARREKAAEDYKRSEAQYDEDEAKSRTRAWMKQYHEEHAQEKKIADLKEKVRVEQIERRDKEREEFEKDLATRLGMHNSTLTSMLQGEATWNDARQKMWQDTGAAIINKILEVGEAWIAGEVTRMAFADAARAETVAANGVTAAAITAQDAAPAALAATMSFGSAAIIGGAALAGIIAMAASYDVGTTSVNGNQLANIHDREMILPTWASIPAQRGDWGPAMRFAGQSSGGSTSNSSSQTNHITVHVSTNASPEQIAKSIVRALPIQQRKFAGSSF